MPAGRGLHVQSRLPEVKLGPRYRVVGEIAKGGMGTVVLAVRTGTNGAAPVAIKKLHAHLVDNADVVNSFVDEARIASRINHPNVVAVHDVEMIGDELMIVMDYIEGTPLRHLLRSVRERERSLPIAVVRRILVDALEGLHAAHELTDDTGSPLGVVHRDVSPHNLIVGSDGVTRVTDFGIAIAAGRLASTRTTGVVKGKLHYLSPEQVFRKPIDRRTDVFAAGVVAWEALVGRKLFDAGSEGETLAMIIREPISPPSSHRFDVPLDLDESCLRALEREADRRFESAWHFARAIEAGGTLAAPEEVGEIVLKEVGATLATRRQLIGRCRSRSLPVPATLDDAEASSITNTPSHPPLTASSNTVLVPRKRSSPLTPAALILLAAVCVTVGIMVGFSVRSTPAPPSQPSVGEGPTIAATSPATLGATEVAEPVPTSPTVTTGLPASMPATSRVKATPPAHRNTPRGNTRPRPDGGRGRPFMPDDL
jgi:serine/threonine-protein kinase